MANHNIRTYFLRLVVLLTVGFGGISTTCGQAAQPRTDGRKAAGYAFVSPNTRENLTLEEAQAGLNSAEEKRLIAEARQVACRLRKPLGVDKAVGSWSDGAEHSTIIRARTNEPSLRYAGSWLGKFARQKAILYFRQSPAGVGRMYVLFLPFKNQNMATVSTELEASGVANRTLVPQRHRLLVYIVDLKNELRLKVLSSARSLRARLASIRGEGEFIGADDREQAQKIFEQEIAKYEAAHPRVRRACPKRISLTLRSTETAKVTGVWKGPTSLVNPSPAKWSHHRSVLQ